MTYSPTIAQRFVGVSTEDFSRRHTAYDVTVTVRPDGAFETVATFLDDPHKAEEMERKLRALVDSAIVEHERLKELQASKC